MEIIHISKVVKSCTVLQCTLNKIAAESMSQKTTISYMKPHEKWTYVKFKVSDMSLCRLENGSNIKDLSFWSLLQNHLEYIGTNYGGKAFCKRPS